MPAAKQAWLTAHLDYERLGAAYNAFGAFDDQIDGLASGLPDGVADKGWTGFFATEYALWHGRAAAKVSDADARPSSRTSRACSRTSRARKSTPATFSLRAHEILENALQFQLTGIADYGSGTTLATIYANTQGTAELLDTLAPLITRADPQLLTAARQGLAALQHDLTADHDVVGDTWLPVSTLTLAQRQRLDADLGQLLETLSGVPALLYPRTDA